MAQCKHDFVEQLPTHPGEFLCAHCGEYAFSQKVFRETNEWWNAVYGKDTDPLKVLQEIVNGEKS